MLKMIQAYGHDVHIVCKNMVFILSFALNKFYKPVRTQCVDVFVISIVVIIVVVSVYRGGAGHSSLICAVGSASPSSTPSCGLP